MKQFIRLNRIPTFTFLLFLFTSLTIVALHLLYHPIRVLGMDTSIFYMDEKYTLAAYLTTITAFLIGFLNLTQVFPYQKTLKRRLINLSFGFFFLFLSFDEYFEVHEHANTLVKASLASQETLFATLANLSWIFPLSLLILIAFGLFIAKIILVQKLPRRLYILGSLAFALVLVFELLGSSTYGQNIYLYYVAIEEGLEMVGTSLFLYGTLLEAKYS